jgi:hypothetical protein
VRAYRSTPAGYVEAGRLDLDQRTKRRLLTLSVGWAVVSLVVVCAIATLVRPVEFTISPDEFRSFPTVGFVLAPLAAWVVASVLTILLHEAVHGAILWWLTGDRPMFGFRGWYAYASAPGWYFTRGWFVVLALAPLVVVTAASLVLYAVLPLGAAAVMLVVAYTNLLGSIGDLYLSWLVVRQRRPTIVEDRPEGITWYQPAE